MRMRLFAAMCKLNYYLLLATHRELSYLEERMGHALSTQKSSSGIQGRAGRF